MEIEDEAWDEPRNIHGVKLDAGDDCYYIEFDDRCPTKEDCQRAKERYMSRGWGEV